MYKYDSSLCSSDTFLITEPSRCYTINFLFRTNCAHSTAVRRKYSHHFWLHQMMGGCARCAEQEICSHLALFVWGLPPVRETITVTACIIHYRQVSWEPWVVYPGLCSGTQHAHFTLNLATGKEGEKKKKKCSGTLNTLNQCLWHPLNTTLRKTAGTCNKMQILQVTARNNKTLLLGK